MSRVDFYPEELISEVNEGSTKLLNLMANFVLTDAKDLVPVDTGRLQRSIHIEEPDEDTRLVGTDVEYAIFVEYGTRHMGAQSFLRAALDYLHDNMGSVLEQV